MDITESLMTALTLLTLGMTFVFMFLGLLFISINLIAKFVPADKPVSAPIRKKPAAKAVNQIEPQIIAAITSAVQQYRKAQTA